MNVNCVVSRSGRLCDQTGKIYLETPLAWNNAMAHAMRYTALDDAWAAADLTGIGVTGSFLRADGETVEPINGTVTGNVAEVILPPACYIVPGHFKFTMHLTDQSGATRSVMWVEGTVERNTSTAQLDPGTPIPNISQAIGQANAAANAATSAASDANTAANAANTAAETANTAAGNATSATGAANTAANAANNAATSANSAASAANQAAASVPQFLMDTLFDWYMEEHSGQVTPFTKIESATITGTNLSSEIVFDPDTTNYSGGATISGTTAMYSISNIVLANPDAEIGTVTYQKVSGTGTLSVTKQENAATIRFTLSGSELIGRLRVPVKYERGGKTYTSTYQLTITVTKAS